MSGIKRKLEDNDPDYEEITQMQQSKRSKVLEQNGKLLIDIKSHKQIGSVRETECLLKRLCWSGFENEIHNTFLLVWVFFSMINS